MKISKVKVPPLNLSFPIKERGHYVNAFDLRKGVNAIKIIDEAIQHCHPEQTYTDSSIKCYILKIHTSNYLFDSQISYKTATAAQHPSPLYESYK